MLNENVNSRLSVAGPPLRRELDRVNQDRLRSIHQRDAGELLEQCHDVMFSWSLGVDDNCVIDLYPRYLQGNTVGLRILVFADLR